MCFSSLAGTADRADLTRRGRTNALRGAGYGGVRRRNISIDVNVPHIVACEEI
jgi:hypothetical protein